MARCKQEILPVNMLQRNQTTFTLFVFEDSLSLSLSIYIYNRANFVQLLLFHRLLSVRFQFCYCLRQSYRLFQSKFSWCNHMNVAEWTDTDGIHHWRILWSSCRKSVWMGFEPRTTEFHSNALTEGLIRPWVQPLLRANFL